jgi:hypothetical protein
LQETANSCDAIAPTYLRDRAEFTGIFWVNPEFFTVFGQKPAAFTDSSAVVGEAFAVRNFGDPQRALGQSIQVENRVYEIASVLKGPRFPTAAEIGSSPGVLAIAG